MTDEGSTSVSKAVLEIAERYSTNDPNLTTSSYVKDLLSKFKEDDGKEDAMKVLSTLFPEDETTRLSFGTAGLRAEMQPGPLGMNDFTVVQTAQGLAKYCLQQYKEKRRAAGVVTPENPSKKMKTTGDSGTAAVPSLRAVVGYDHRAQPDYDLTSSKFAILTKLVFESVGVECEVLDGYIFTPLVPYTLQKLNAVVGIMITASHNPKQDAGYKVYSFDGCQIRSPTDQHISAYIEDNLIPWKNYAEDIESKKKSLPDINGDDLKDPCSKLGYTNPELTKEMLSSYYDSITHSGLRITRVTSSSSPTSTKLPPPPKICYTAMHGVGYPYATRVFEEFNLQPFISVKEQQDPDPTFPTVPFPNPEEKGALDIAKAYAEKEGCNIVLANDPDADRLAVAEFDPTTKEWTVFHGDQIGAMLGLWIWEQVGKKSNKPVSMCASTVSSKLLAEIARVEGFKFEDTLTGFKWIGSRAAELTKKEGYRNLFCYEEAIGFCCGDVIFDKDGISALAVFAQLANYVYIIKSMTLKDHMQQIYYRYGEFVSYNGYYVMKDKKAISIIMDHIRQGGTYNMDYLGPNYQVQSIRDLGVPGYDSTTDDKKPTLPTSSSAPMITIRFTNGCVAQFRASGTEPKFKYYVEMKGKPRVPRSTVERELKKMADTILDKLLIPSESGLTLPTNG